MESSGRPFICEGRLVISGKMDVRTGREDRVGVVVVWGGTGADDPFTSPTTSCDLQVDCIFVFILIWTVHLFNTVVIVRSYYNAHLTF